MRSALPLLLLLPVALAAVAWSAVQSQPAAPTDRPAIPRGPFSEERIDAIKQTMLERVNEDRAHEGLGPVEFDERAELVADLFTAEALENNTINHYTLDGISPFGRWGLAGGVDWVAENSCAWYWTGPTYRWTEELVLEQLHSFQDQMLAEKPPADGHRRTILDPHNTHLGIGLAISEEGTRLRYAQEFLCRYVEIAPELPTEVHRTESVTVTGGVLDPEKYRAEFVLVYYEPEPQPISAEECASRHVYGPPKERKILRPILPDGHYYLPDRGQGEVEMDADKSVFRVKIPWFKGAGWYYVAVVLTPRDAPEGTGQFHATFPLIRVTE